MMDKQPTIDRLMELAAKVGSAGPTGGTVCASRPPLVHLPEIRTPYYDFLWLVVSEFRPRTVLEIGTYEAVSTMVMADAMISGGGWGGGGGGGVGGGGGGGGGGRIITVDCELRPAACLRLRQYQNVAAIQCDSHRLLEMVVPVPLDLVFLDSLHTVEQARGDFERFWPLLADGGLFLCDDIDYDDGMRGFWSMVPMSGGKSQSKLLHGSGFGFVIK